jgi:hypothetical protein
MAKDELSIAGRCAQVLEQRGSGVPQMINLDHPKVMD